VPCKFANAAPKCDPTPGALPPLLVIHGDSDTNVPIENGRQLWEHAAEPKAPMVVIKKGNHLLTNGASLKKALKEMHAFWSSHKV
jgi:alpha-beta hydrolase superfamily lysophospholipase